MIYLFKKYGWLMILVCLVNLPILIFGSIRTDQTVTLKGDTTKVENFVEIDQAFTSSGSFSTIYVISFDHSTILQNWLLSASTTATLATISDSYQHFTDAETRAMGRIQHNASIQYSLIVAYRQASRIDPKIHLDYTFNGYLVSYYSSESDFRIGDRIVAINDLSYTDPTFSEHFSKRKTGDIVTVERNSRLLEITLSDTNHVIGGYADYRIDDENAFPNYTILPTNVGGPSGGLLQTLALYDALLEEDLTGGKKIAGTGTISVDGTVGIIGGIVQKIYTAYDDDIDLFLCPKDNYEEALTAYNRLPHPEKMKLYSVATFEDALRILEENR